ncbi:MAG: threonine synthase [Legionellales bacterium]|jgi:threonine synthase
MKYLSTRGQDLINFDQAIQTGLAPDGGLYVPKLFPKINFEQLPYAQLATTLLKPFVKDSKLENQIADICEQAFNFPVPLTQLNANTELLELFHGPTVAFKDFGARFLAQCMNRLATQKMTLMIATSGDTGSAVASAFHGFDNIQVVILYPEGKISERQAHQINCWGDNILPLAVQGTFDDCQALVKSAFTNKKWQAYTHLSTANSINIGRLLPQMAYYAFSSLQYQKQYGEGARFIVPSGNLGNVTAAFWAKQIGCPIAEIVVATNANSIVPDYIHTGNYQPKPSVETLANAMDVGNPSNFERLNYLFKTHENFAKNMPAFSVSDQQITETIKSVYKNHQQIICPHTATACYVRNQLSDKPWIVVATAHASKFEEIIEPMLDIKILVPPALQLLLNKPQSFIPVIANEDVVFDAVKSYFSAAS